MKTLCATINGNAVQDRLSENYLTWTWTYRIKYLDLRYNQLGLGYHTETQLVEVERALFLAIHSVKWSLTLWAPTRCSSQHTIRTTLVFMSRWSRCANMLHIISVYRSLYTQTHTHILCTHNNTHSVTCLHSVMCTCTHNHKWTSEFETSRVL